jgi:hypothetical protein
MELEMVQDSRSAKFVRGLVKFVFIGCYAAFMWASIHHVAVYFDNFEQNGPSDMFGSYLLAGAFDVTALVTTIGVMFFRKSMPRYVQIIVWVFIVAIAAYSFFINWEYAAHFQNADLVLQPTGITTPVFDQQGNLHYVMVMKANTNLLVVNPLLASGFTIFSLIYSVVAEFFGTKAPTVAELQARKKYLEETAGVLDAIKQLEQKDKGKGLIASLKDKAIEGKAAWKEVTARDETGEETDAQSERNTDELEAVPGGETGGKQEGHFEPTEEANIIINQYPNTRSWLTAGPSTVPLKVVSETMNLSMKTLNNRVAKKQIRATKNRAIVYKSSLVRWAIAEVIPEESKKVIHLNAVRNDGAASGQSEDVKLEKTIEALANDPAITDEMLAETLGLDRPAAARFWRLKANEIKDREAVPV